MFHLLVAPIVYCHCDTFTTIKASNSNIAFHPNGVLPFYRIEDYLLSSNQITELRLQLQERSELDLPSVLYNCKLLSKVDITGGGRLDFKTTDIEIFHPNLETLGLNQSYMEQALNWYILQSLTNNHTLKIFGFNSEIINRKIINVIENIVHDYHSHFWTITNIVLDSSNLFSVGFFGILNRWLRRLNHVEFSKCCFNYLWDDINGNLILDLHSLRVGKIPMDITNNMLFPIQSSLGIRKLCIETIIGGTEGRRVVERKRVVYNRTGRIETLNKFKRRKSKFADSIRHRQAFKMITIYILNINSLTTYSAISGRSQALLKS